MSEQDQEVDSVEESSDAVQEEQERTGEPTSAGAPDEIVEPESSEASDVSEDSEADEAHESDDADDADDAEPEDESPVVEDVGDEDSDELDDLFLSPDEESEGVIEVDVVGEQEAASSTDDDAASQAAEQAAQAHAEEKSQLEARISELEEKLETIEEDRNQTRERLMRSAADLENFRKRSKRERDELRKYGIDKLCLELIPAVDNLERALAHAEASEEQSNILDGVKMVYKQIIAALEKHGVTGFNATGEQFNPEHHEAIQQVESSEHDTGEVVEQFQKGYFIHDRLLRPALVSVAKRVEPDDNEEQSHETDHDEEREDDAESDEPLDEASESADE